MSTIDFKKLKSGTDIRGVASNCLGGKITLDGEIAEIFAKAFVKWLSVKLNKTKLKIAVGCDSRITAKELSDGFCKGATESGCDVVCAGLSSTPSMFILLKQSDFNCDASVMITASHLPADRNGLKFFIPSGGLGAKDIDELIFVAEKGDFLSGHGEVTYRSFMDEYSAILAAYVRSNCDSERPLEGKKIIVDAGNGAGGFFAEKVLKPLGADTSGSLFLEPDGTFPNHIPNPEDGKAIAFLKEAVLKNNADLGVIFDTDVDRAAIVDSRGNEINRNRLIALLSAMLFKERTGTIVTDSVTSDGLTEFIESRGGKHCRYKRGYKNVIDKCISLNEQGEYSPLAIETSGHAAFKENYYLDDGAYLITRILILVAKQTNGITELIKDLKEPAEAVEIRLAFKEGVDFRSKGEEIFSSIISEAEKTRGVSVAKENYEGVRLCFDRGFGDGWSLVRMSLHDPILPINIESDIQGGIAKIIPFIYSVLSRFEYLDAGKLENYLG
ncbi:MAG: phosphomannomutase/phosphoglucomutase [Clostridia bacterium]|nr:phosphomannomutase/phosphoglucomutase [Clostridia bacterium]